jgi:hypothetical protein
LRGHDAADLCLARPELLQQSREVDEEKGGEVQQRVGERGEDERPREERGEAGWGSSGFSVLRSRFVFRFGVRVQG